MHAKFANHFFAIFILLTCCLSVVAQNKCDLQIEVYEFREDGSSEQFPVPDAKIEIFDSKTKKSLKINKNENASLFAGVNDGEYLAVVSKVGFRKTLANFSVDCRSVNAENKVSVITFLWTGNAAETFDLSAKLNGITEKQYKAEAGPLNSSAVFLGKPIYPQAALAVGATGKVEVQVTIDELGRVISAQAVSGHPLLRAAAVKAAKESKFRMTFLEGIPVKVTGVIVYNFVP